MPQPRLRRPGLHGHGLRRRLPRGLRKNRANISDGVHHPRLAQQLDRIRFHHRIALPQSRMSRVQGSARLRIRLHRVRRNIRRHRRKLRSGPLGGKIRRPHASLGTNLSGGLYKGDPRGLRLRRCVARQRFSRQQSRLRCPDKRRVVRLSAPVAFLQSYISLQIHLRPSAACQKLRRAGRLSLRFQLHAALQVQHSRLVYLRPQLHRAMLRAEFLYLFSGSPRTAHISRSLDSREPPLGGNLCRDDLRAQICRTIRALRFQFRVFHIRSRRSHKFLRAKRRVQRERQLSRAQTRRVSFRLHRPVQLHRPRVPLKIEALPRHTNGFFRTRTRRLFSRDVISRRQQRKHHIPQQPHRPFFGVILDSHSFPTPIRKDELHGLVRPRHPTGAVKDHPAGLHVYLLLCFHFWIFCCPLGFRPALQVELHFAAAGHASARFFILAALRMNRVVTLSGLPENGDLHVLEQTGVLILEVRGLRRFHRKNLLGSLSLGKREPARHPHHILRSRRRRFLPLSISAPFALEVHTGRQTCQQQRRRRRPARILRRFASLHVFS